MMRDGAENAARRRRLGLAPAAWSLAAAAVAIGASAPAAAAPVTERVSVSSSGAQGNGGSISAFPSADGRFVAFSSAASNLVPGDTNNARDVFVHDRRTGRTERVSVGVGGAQANDSSSVEGISANTRFVLFASKAFNLVPGDTNAKQDVFVRDRQAGKTERISLRQGNGQIRGISFAAGISDDGRFVGFATSVGNVVAGDTNGMNDMFVRDRKTGKVERVSLGNGGVQANSLSIGVGLSATGRFALFDSFATNLVPGPVSGFEEVFVRDRQTGVTQRVSVGPGGRLPSDRSFGASISDNGRFVGFYSAAANLAAGDTAGTFDAFVRDRQAGRTEIVSVNSSEVKGSGESSGAAISADGRFVTFDSDAANLVPGDTNGTLDVFVRDRRAGTTRRVSLSSSGAQGNGGSYFPALSADGRTVAFFSLATNLVPGDTNNTGDAFVRAPAP
jgi:Tol biopolymer transport system component